MRVWLLFPVGMLALSVSCKRFTTFAHGATHEEAAISGVDGSANLELEDLASTLEPFRAKGELPALGAFELAR